MAKKLFKGNEAIAEAAVLGGCRYYFGYPITPQTEISEYLVKRLFEVGGDFIQAESEVSAINMVYGAGGAGGRVMTSSSSPGISLKQEGISYLCASEIPCVIVNMVRAGPGLGGIMPSQADYFQAVKGGGHGDYKMLVFSPSTIQEAVDIMYNAFDKAEEYRIPVFILGEGMLGQLMEPVEFPEMKEIKPTVKNYTTTGDHHGKDRRIINSLYLVAAEEESHNLDLQAKYKLLEEKETKCEEYMCDDAELIISAYGSMARICKSVIKILRQKGIKAGLIRPITLFPFPTKVYEKYAAKKSVSKFFVTEMSAGQFVEDVKLSVNGKKEVEFYGRMGGYVPTPDEIVQKVMEVIK